MISKFNIMNQEPLIHTNETLFTPLKVKLKINAYNL